MNQNIYSNAFNFESYLQSGVDIRTGQYTIQIQLASISSHYSNGPQLDFQISYSPLCLANQGFGIGWTTNFSQLDITQNRLTLSNGQSYIIKSIPPGDNVTIKLKDQKLLDFTVIKINSKQFNVIYKGGKTESLKCWGSEKIARLYRIIEPNGLALELKRDYIVSGEYWPTDIIEVGETAQTLLTLIYKSSGVSEINYLLDDNTFAKSHLYYTNEKLNTYILATTNDLEESKYQFDYQTTSTGYLLISELTHPTGQSESIKYNETGHQMPNQQSIPYAISHQLKSGNSQPIIHKTYSFSSYNFLGFGKLTNWNDGEDNLYLVTGDYDYWGEEKWLDDNNTVIQKTQNTYNKYHLVCSEVQSQNVSIVEKITEYNEDPNVNFYEQPAYLQLPKKITTTYYRSDTPSNNRKEVESYTYDDAGNILSSEMPSGIKIQNVYYSATGEDGCPPSAGELTQYLKSQQIIPYTTQNNEITRITTCQYEKLEDMNNMVVRMQEHMNSELSRIYTYFGHSESSVAQGRISQIQEFMPDQSKTTKQFIYEVTEGLLKETIQTIGHDHLHKQIVQYLGAYSQNIFKAIDEDGVQTDFKYDILNRILEATVTPQTENAASKKLSYTVGRDNNTVSITNAKGVMQILHYDNMGRCIRKAQQLSVQQSLYDTYYCHYDCLGRISKEQYQDWYEAQIINTQEKTYTYDDWGELSSTASLDGVVEINTFDPILLKRTQGIQNLAFTEIYYNSQQQIIETRKFDANSIQYASTQNHYDGFWRIIKEVNTADGITRYTYDEFDRIKTQNLPENLSLSFEYESFSRESLYKKICLNNTTLGSRLYDGLGRTILESCNGYETEYKYTTSSLYPTESITPLATSNVLYNANLRHITQHSIIQQESLTTKYNLDSVSGLLKMSQTANDTCEYEYDTIGRLSNQIQTTGELSVNMTHTYSLTGKIMTETDYLNQRIDYEYDIFGRLLKKIWFNSNSDIVNASVSLEYDNFSRLKVYNYALLDTTKYVQVTLDYDERSQEKTRTYISPGGTISINQLFTESHQLSQRVQKNNNIIVLTENFQYDLLGRLINYKNTGSNGPVDEYGLQIQAEDYTFNDTSSLSCLKRTFINGEENIVNFYFENFAHPQLLTRLTNTHPNYLSNIPFQYDECGNLVAAGEANYTYDPSNKLIGVRTETNTVSYEYNSEDSLNRIKNVDKELQYLWFDQSTLLNESSQSQQLSYHKIDDIIIGAYGSGTQTRHCLMTTTNQGTPIMTWTYEAEEVSEQSYRFTPYGQRSGIDEDQFSLPIGANSERLDTSVNLYPLGGGFRAFNPSIMRFLSADPLSPFEEGGLNAYAYASGDPINFSDPSGQSTKDTLKTVGSFLFTIGSILAIPFTGGSSAAMAAAFLSGSLILASKSIDVAAKKQSEQGHYDKAARLKHWSAGLTAASYLVNIGNLGRAAYKPWGTAATRSGKNSYTTYRKVKKADPNRALQVGTRPVHHTEVSGRSFSFQVQEKPIKNFSKPRAGFQLKTTRTPTDFSKGRIQRLKSSSDFTSAATDVAVSTAFLLAAPILTSITGTRASEDGTEPKPAAPLAISTSMPIESDSPAGQFVQAGLLTQQEDQNPMEAIRDLQFD